MPYGLNFRFPPSFRGAGVDLLPKNTALPSIVGLVEIGETVEADTGTWTDADSISYVWRIDGADVGDPDDDLEIPDDPALQLQTLTLVVTATNAHGSRSRSVSQVIPGVSTLETFNVTDNGGEPFAVSEGNFMLEAA